MEKTKNYIYSFLGWLSLSYLLLSLIYSIALLKTEDIIPNKIFSIILPLIIGVTFAIIAKKRILIAANSYKLIFGIRISEIQFIISFVICVLIGFNPIATSLRYNLAYVLDLTSIDELDKFQQPPFLQVGEWYADRLRVVPVKSYEFGTFFNADKVHLNAMFLIPIFSKERAYQGGAKAWLAFDYTETIPKSEFEKTKGKLQFDGFIRHFKKINVRAFNYFESYPVGKQKQAYIYLATTHTFFKSGFVNIYKGQDVDRDILALQQVRLFIYYILFIILPIIVLSHLFHKLSRPR